MVLSRFLRLIIAVAVVASSLAATGPAANAAQYITFAFSGVVDDSQTSLVTEGTPFSGTFTYDLDAFDAIDDPILGAYSFPLPGSAPVGFAYTLGVRSFIASESVDLSILDYSEDHSEFDSFLEDSFNIGGSSPGLEGDLIDGSVDLIGPVSTFSTDRPPGTLELSAFAFGGFSGTILATFTELIRGRPVTRVGERIFTGSIESLTLVSIVSTPEPSGVVLLGTGGLATLGSLVRRYRVTGR
ncbi:MAG: PEP-CTERM sorting domain-containing protein [Isosphaeraceae bacterium]|nr:PEP-CTERM sorting domain-containing protein [Isosphaeraceae bacterium]